MNLLFSSMKHTKNSPAIQPTGTASETARGILTVASPHSSVMDVSMPMAENLAYWLVNAIVSKKKNEERLT